MFCLIVSSYGLQSQLYLRALRHENIYSLVENPKALVDATHIRPDLVLIPHPLLEESPKGFWEWCEIISQHAPIVFLGHCQQKSSSAKLSIQALQRCVFIDDPNDISQLCNILKDLIVLNKKRQNALREMKLGEFTLDKNRYLLLSKLKYLRLTKKEFYLLELLAQHRGQVLTRERIMEYVWDKGNYVAENTIDVYVSRLRKKLRSLTDLLQIDTIPCLGYELKTISEKLL